MSENDAHIQDSQILAMSKQETNDAGNKIRFLADLPSGRRVETPWFDPGVKRGKLQAWLEGVRAEIARDEEETRLASRRKARESTLPESPPDVPSAESLQQTHTSSTHSGSTYVPTRVEQASPSMSAVQSPDQYVKQEYVKAAERSVYWREECIRAAAEWKAAKESLKKWGEIARSIGVVTSEEDVAGGSAGVESDGVQPDSCEDPAVE